MCPSLPTGSEVGVPIQIEVGGPDHLHGGGGEGMGAIRRWLCGGDCLHESVVSVGGTTIYTAVVEGGADEGPAGVALDENLIVHRYWERHDVRGAIGALEKMADHGVLADVIRFFTEKPDIITLDTVEIQVRKVYCVSKAVPTIPINNEDAARSEVEIDKAL
ncbi:hypothetical protein C3L33_02786, partial [Rhododendron williamsianum]